MNKRKILLILILSLLIFVSFVTFGSLFKKNKLSFFASKVIDICSKKEDKAACYDVEIPKLLSKRYVSMEEAFAVTKIIQEKDRSYLFCHVLGHNLADVETKKDPSKWLDVVSRCPALECNNGCPHGAIMRRFKGEEVLNNDQIDAILPDLKIACEKRDKWNPTEVESFMCYHSMGHVLMYITNADIDKSLEICKEIGVKGDGRDYYQTCAQGVFMIIFQGLDPEDISLVSSITPKKDNVVNFCNKYTGLENVACRTEAWPLYYSEFEDPSSLNSFCAFTTNKYDKYWCFDTVLRGPLTLDLLNSSGIEKVAEYCLKLNFDMREHCFAAISTSWVQDEPGFASDSISLCKKSEEFGLSGECYYDLLYYSKYSFHKDTPEWRDYCNAFDGDNKEKCISGDVPDSFKNLE